MTPFTINPAPIINAASPAFLARAKAWEDTLRSRASPTARSPAAPPRPAAYEDEFLAHHRAALDAAGDGRITFDEAAWDRAARSAVVFDSEVFKNFAVFCFKRMSDGKRIAFELSDRCPLEHDDLRAALEVGVVVTFNGAHYDMPVAALALSGADNAALYDVSWRLVNGHVKPWEVEREFKVRLPAADHIDLMEPNPSVRQGLKTLSGRLHARWVVDLPFAPDKALTPREMNVATLYCMNDLDCTQTLAEALREPLALRSAMSREAGTDLRSKSDAQVGEAVVVRRVERATGRRVGRGSGGAPASVRYRPPALVSFSSPALRRVLDGLAVAEFQVVGDKVKGPDWLREPVRVGGTAYQMGVGGLHSTEESRSVTSDAENVLIDADVTGHYPNIIATLGLCPPALGPAFLDAYRGMLAERTEAKRRQQEIESVGVDDETRDEHARSRAKAEGLKISTNGVFGKLGSLHGPLYAPDLMLAVTLTGQLTVLMLIERAETTGVRVVSANTDGATFLCPRAKEAELCAILDAWGRETGFAVERTRYRSLHSRDVNTYVAVREDGKVKRKGPIGNPWADGDLRGQMSKNPQMTACSDAVVALIRDGVPLADTVRACRDPRAFVTVIKVTGGAVWRGHPLGRVARFYWSKDGDPIMYADGKRKVAKTDGARPMVMLPDELPSDLDLARYIAEAEKVAGNLGVEPYANQDKRISLLG